MNAYYTSTILRVGAEAAELIAGGILILFGEPLPEDLEPLSVVHAPSADPIREMHPGDELWLGDLRLTLTAVGERAQENLRTLGHVVVYTDTSGDVLPGAIHANGALDVPEAGTELRLVRGTADE